MISLRPDYQLPVKNAIIEAWQRYRSVLAVIATGGGKTVIFSKLIKEANAPALAIAHRKEIMVQISKTFAKEGLKHYIIAPNETLRIVRRSHFEEFGKSYLDENAPVLVASVQTLTSKNAATDKRIQRRLSQLSLSVFDEGHHYIDKSMWGRAVHLTDNAKRLFVTACPERSDGIGLGIGEGGFVDYPVYGPQCQWLIENGYLSPFKYFAPSTDLNLTDLKLKSNGDFNMQALRDRVVESHLVGDALKHYDSFANGKKSILFAPDVATSNELAAMFSSQSIKAVALDGNTDVTLRERCDKEFRSGALSVLTNVDLFDEGYDVPSAECAILCRPTWSLNKFLQMCGRVLRPVYAEGYDLSTVEGRKAAIAAGPKPHAVIIDMVRNWERLGLPNWERSWSLKGRDKTLRSSDSAMPPMTFCLSCTQPFEAFHKCCPYCGRARGYAQRSKPEQVEGSLEELDVDALQSLMSKVSVANCSDEDHAVYQAQKHMPMIARSRDLRRHREAKETRKTLQNLIGWWVGAQKGRSMAEIHRRFFHRFGVDIATAFTLNAKKTQELITLIADNFAHDVVNLHKVG